MLEEAHFDRLIAGDRHAIRVYLGLAIAVVLFGLALCLISLIGLLDSGGEIQGLGLKLGGAFVSSLGAFPVKEYLNRRDRIHATEAIREMWIELKARGTAAGEDLKRLEDIIWKKFEKGAVG